MKHIVLLVIGLMAATAAFAQKPQSLFNKANKMYRHQAYDSALAIYTKLIKDGYNNTGLYLNAGNTSYKLKKSGYAVYYFTKALQQKPGSKYIQHNLQMAQVQAYNKIDQIPTLFFVRWWHAILQWFSVNTWLILSLVFFWIFIFFLGWLLLSHEPPRFINWIWLPVVILFCFFMLGAVFSRMEATTHDSAIVIAGNKPLKKAPDKNSTSIDFLRNGIKVEILDSVANWDKIELTDGTEGWFNTENMKAL